MPAKAVGGHFEWMPALAGGASVRDAAQHAAEGTEPSSDINGSSEYREHLARVLTQRALEAASA